MIKVNFNNQLIEVPVGTKVIDLLNESDKTNYVVCQIGSLIKELDFELTEKHNEMNIIPIGLNNIEASKAYEATLRYIVSMAFYRLYPGINIRFSYNASRSLFCEILTSGFHSSRVTEQIINEVNSIINENLPIEKILVSIEKAKEIYKEYNHLDKMEILKYRPEDSVHLYKCGNYYDYMHSYMAPSTGCIKNYSIRPYSPGIIIQYPRYELDAEIPEFVEETTYGKTLRNAYEWSKKTNLQTIVDINYKVEENGINDFIQMCETRHNKMLSELGDNIEKDIKNIRLIGIAGPSSSGKTTFCNRLRIELLSRGINPVTISMDDYYLEKTEISRIQNRPLNDLDLEHINCLDIEQFNKDLFDLINGEEVTLPHFNFQTGLREKGKTIRVDENSPIIIEGIHALNDKLTSSIPKHQKYKIYIAPQAQINIDDHSPLNTTDLRLIRRIVRDMKYRNCPAIETIKMWQSVRNGEFKWIYPHQEGADFVFNSQLSYELCILRTKALSALREIKPTEPEYIVANRLIKYLKYFRPIESEELIPCNSLLREFIGGSCFKC